MIDICFKSLHPRVVLTTSITSNTTTAITIMGGGVLMTQIFRDQQRERERGAETSVGQKETSRPR